MFRIQTNRLISAAPIVVLAFLFAAMAPAALAAKPKCFGKRATITSKAAEIQGTKNADVIVANGKDNVIIGGGGPDLICAKAGDDIISGDTGNDKLSGGAGTDFFQGAAGNDRLVGGPEPRADGEELLADDTALYFNASTGVNVDLQAGTASGDGNDTLESIEDVLGSPHDDVLTGDGNTNALLGDDGNDTIDGAGALDLLEGDSGDDNINGGEGLDLADYRAATERVDVDLNRGTGGGATEGNDQLANIEIVGGSPFDDDLTGNTQSNYFFPEGGNDNVNGGGGAAVDYLVYWFAENSVRVDLGAGTATGPTIGTDRLTNIQGVFGTTDFNDVLIGDARDNFLDGDGGNDELLGAEGDDLLLGAAGDDTINGGPGTQDLADFFAAATITANLTLGTATGEGTDTLAGIEWLGGADSDDVLTGDANNNVILGWGGNDTIDGGLGDDFLNGGAGTDVLDGKDGTDNCSDGETTNSCEGTEVPPIHPLQVEADNADNFRRNF